MGFGVWLTVVSLHAQCLRRNRFLRVNSCGSKRTFEGIWTNVSCIFDCILIAHFFNLDIRNLDFESG